mgnify:FL=1|jgi:hypothetical protein
MVTFNINFRTPYMQTKFLILFLTSMLLFSSNEMDARPRRSKSCIRKVLLPGQSKPVKCTKARKIKNNYFF